MAKINVSYDTETKDLELTIDGQVKGDVTEVRFYSDQYEDEKYGGFQADFKNIKENGVVYRLHAIGSKLVKSDPIEDFARGVFNKS